ncbi:MAG: peptidoglycan-binding protein [Woeseiaceae bacterium]|nr:peptidoglycan-binding protein [Woeseiaceae bacterium]
MSDHFIRISSILALGFSMTATAADVESLAECAREQQQAQLAGVNNYAVVINIMGSDVPQYFERASLASPSGGSYETFVLVPPGEIARRQDQHGMTADALDHYADGLRMTGDALETETLKSGMPVGMIYSMGPPPGEEPWASPRPSVMMGSMADFVEFAAEAKRRKEDGVPISNDFEKVFANAEIVGATEINNRNAWHLLSDNLNITDNSNGQQFTIKSIDFWMDKDDCVPLKFHMKGKAADEDGKQRDIFIERTELDYRKVPGTNMLLSYHQVMRMGGVLTPAEEKQMAEARVQMADFEKQLAEMPPSERAMMERMMGSRMETMRKMLDTGAFEMELRVKDVRVNEGVDGLMAVTKPFGIPVGETRPTGGSASGGSQAVGLVGMIQRDLKKLGYYNGAVDGERTKMTVVAISRYQAEHGMEVTGEPTPQLAGRLSAAVDAMN